MKAIIGLAIASFIIVSTPAFAASTSQHPTGYVVEYGIAAFRAEDLHSGAGLIAPVRKDVPDGDDGALPGE